MILITGGAFEGKKEYAAKRFSFGENEITDGRTASAEEIMKAVCVVNYHDFVKRISPFENPEEFTASLVRENPSAVVIMNEIGSGIIPLEKSERIWREQTGRCGCIIASAASEVIRLCCGIPSVIKGGEDDN